MTKKKKMPESKKNLKKNTDNPCSKPHVPKLTKCVTKKEKTEKNQETLKNLKRDMRRTTHKQDSSNLIRLYLACTQDKYELPMLIERDIVELARKVGASQNLIYQCIAGRRTGKEVGYKFFKIYIEEE